MEKSNTVKLMYLWLLVTLVMLGALLLIKSQSYPWYEPHGPEVFDYSELSRENRTGYWEKKSAELETPRKFLHDSGQGIMALAATLGFLYFSYGFPLKGARTPETESRLYLLYIAPFVLAIPASFYYHLHRLGRFEYPPWSDSIRVPVILTALVFFSAAIFGVIIMDTVLSLGRMPAKLYVWPAKRRLLHVLIALITLLLCTLCLAGIGLSVINGDMGVVSILTVTLYIILTIRAALANSPDEYLAYLAGSSD